MALVLWPCAVRVLFWYACVPQDKKCACSDWSSVQLTSGPVRAVAQSGSVFEALTQLHLVCRRSIRIRGPFCLRLEALSNIRRIAGSRPLILQFAPRPEQVHYAAQPSEQVGLDRPCRAGACRQALDAWVALRLFAPQCGQNGQRASREAAKPPEFAASVHHRCHGSPIQPARYYLLH